jgi:hypothetical protein
MYLNMVGAELCYQHIWPLANELITDKFIAVNFCTLPSTLNVEKEI